VRQELDHDEVSLVVQVNPAALYDLVADITRTPEFSPNVIRARWIGGATGPAVGARFKAYPAARRGRAPSNKPVVTVANPAIEFAFNRVLHSYQANHHTRVVHHRNPVPRDRPQDSIACRHARDPAANHGRDRVPWIVSCNNMRRAGVTSPPARQGS
jgi:hypothetical protein